MSSPRPPGHKLEDLRALQDWVLEPAIRQVPGVGDVNAFGGGIKQYQVLVKPQQLTQHGVTLQQVFTALQNNNSNTGGNILKTGEQSLVVRGVNALTSVRRHRRPSPSPTTTATPSTSATSPTSAPTWLPARASSVGMNGPKHDKHGKITKPAREVDDIVEAIILNRKGTNALKVVKGVKAKVAELNDPAKHILPPGVKLVAGL